MGVFFFLYIFFIYLWIAASGGILTIDNLVK